MKEQDELSPPEEHHTFLILDRHVQSIPWESLPALRGRSLSRIPNMAFLADRLALAEVLQPKRKTKLTTTRPNRGLFSFPLDVTKGFFILNPSGDLVKTQAQFEPWVKRLEEAGWEGITGRAPSEMELIHALSAKDIVVFVALCSSLSPSKSFEQADLGRSYPSNVFLPSSSYFGHGGAEQYIRSHKIRSLPRCASLMLWGCSSGALKDMGELDRVGTPWNYILAGW